MKKPSFEAADKAVQSLSAAISSLREEREALVSELEKLHSQKEALFLQPISKADAKQFIFDYIDLRAKSWLELGQIDSFFKRVEIPPRSPEWAKSNGINDPRLTLLDIDASLYQGMCSHIFRCEALKVAGNAFYLMGQGNDAGACFFFGDIIKEKVGEYFDEKYPELPTGLTSLPVNERREQIAVLVEQIQGLMGVIQELDNKLLAMGFKDIRKLKLVDGHRLVKE